MAQILENVRFIKAVRQETELPQDGLPEIVLAGRSNVGKSSLVNALAGQRLSRVSQTPGKTQQILYFKVGSAFYLTDLPGYGYTKAKEARKSFTSFVDRYFSLDRPIQAVALLLDLRLLPSEQDLQMLSYLADRALPAIIILTKGDKLSRSQRLQQTRLITEQLRESGFEPEKSDIFVISNRSGEGIAALTAWIRRCLCP
ncbi:MAG: ribosome biogenesis GTP-binding protein YihA/YsxC [Oscillospiraceae bacterium]|nr:ribosome biogenesis GTP-binding protein YihA/YsxC [Oscillospiraceae bacterium]MDD4368591.1 ribosome biogenesis GTP-binding protein YihA/YsxC [Oscillospiraceae bacterium]